jgi:hypothetical protein
MAKPDRIMPPLNIRDHEKILAAQWVLRPTHFTELDRYLLFPQSID